MNFKKYIHLLAQQKLASYDAEIKFWWDYNSIEIARLYTEKINYVVYQTEDLEIKLDELYKKFLDKAVAVYDYSVHNLEFYPKAHFLPMLPDLNSKSQVSEEPIYDILFAGTVTERRAKIIEKLRETNEVTVVLDVDVDKLSEMMIRSNWVLSIGAYNTLHNDCFRVKPALDAGANVLVEKTEELWYNEYLNKFGDRVKWLEI